MTQTMGTLAPSFTVNARLAGHLADLAVGRSLVIGFFASRRCGVVSGDLTVSWGPLRRAEPEFWPGGFLDRRTPSIRLGRPESWLQFLEGPVVTSPRRPA